MSKKKMQKQKHQIGIRIAFGLLALAVVVGVWALLSRDDTNSGGVPGGGVATGSATPGATASAEPTMNVPKKLVNPLKGKNYCATLNLLGIYAHQSYGLDEELQLTEGKKFSNRLTTIAATYKQLAKQASDQAKVGNAAVSWSKLSRATASAEDKLKASGLAVNSQLMIGELAKLSKVSRTELPKAASTMQAACGLAPSHLGL